MPNIAFFGQMGGGGTLPAEAHHLVEWVAMGKLRIQLLAEFTGPVRPDLESFLGDLFDVFH